MPDPNARLDPLPPRRGRGAAANPRNRFERIDVDPDFSEVPPDERPDPRTLYLPDASRSIITANDSPDIPFERSLNPYRGCEHGCAYCYARPTHEYLGYSAGLDFETRILAKHDAPALLRDAIRRPGSDPIPIAMSGVTDPYQPVERKLLITRGCLEVLAEARHPVMIVTKNAMITRDLDLLAHLARFNAVRVSISVTSLDPAFARALEPRTSTPAARLDAIRRLREAGIPVGALIAPVIPGLTDEHIPALVQAAADAGAQSVGYVVLRLPYAVKDIFEQWLDHHAPLRKDKVLNRMRELRGGKLYDAAFGQRMRGQGLWADQLAALFRIARRRAGLDHPRSAPVSSDHFRRPRPLDGQLELF